MKVVVVVRVASSVFSPVDVEYVSMITVVIVTGRVRANVAVTGALDHHVSTIVFVTVTSVEHGSGIKALLELIAVKPVKEEAKDGTLVATEIGPETNERRGVGDSE